MKRIVPAWRPLALAASALAAAAAAAATDIFELPALHDRFLALKRDMVVRRFKKLAKDRPPSRMAG